MPNERYSHIDAFIDDPIRKILSEELRFRRQKNKKYSIRAFALSLDIDQSLLSRYLKGSVAISRPSKEKILRRLGYKQSDIKKILAMNEAELDYRKVDKDIFKVMSEWYYFAVLELMKIKEFDPSPANIAERLAITNAQAEEALRLLLQFNFICRDNSDRLILSRPNNTWSSATKTDMARRIYQKRILEKSSEALLTVDISERQHLSMTMAIDKRRLPEFKSKLFLLQRELSESFQEEGEYNDVYQLIVNFFPLTKR